MGQAVHKHGAGLFGAALGGLEKTIVGQPLGHILLHIYIIGRAAALVKLYHLQPPVAVDDLQNA